MSEWMGRESSVLGYFALWCWLGSLPSPTQQMERWPQFTKPDCKYRLCAVLWFRSQSPLIWSLWMATATFFPVTAALSWGIFFFYDNCVKLLSLIHYIWGWFVLMGFSLNLMPLALFAFKRPFSIFLWNQCSFPNTTTHFFLIFIFP